MEKDKNTIGITPTNQNILDYIFEKRLFNDQIEVAKMALAYAISKGIKPTEVKGADTKWNVGSFDRDGKIRTLLPILFPNTNAPYRATESLVNEGLEMLADYRALHHDIDFIDILKNINEDTIE